MTTRNHLWQDHRRGNRFAPLGSATRRKAACTKAVPDKNVGLHDRSWFLGYVVLRKTAYRPNQAVISNRQNGCFAIDCSREDIQRNGAGSACHDDLHAEVASNLRRSRRLNQHKAIIHLQKQLLLLLPREARDSQPTSLQQRNNGGNFGYIKVPI